MYSTHTRTAIEPSWDRHLQIKFMQNAKLWLHFKMKNKKLKVDKVQVKCLQVGGGSDEAI